MKKIISVTIAITVCFAFGLGAGKAQSAEIKRPNNTWVAELMKDVGPVASVNGLDATTDRFHIIIADDDCSKGIAFFPVTSKRPQIAALAGKTIPLEFNGERVGALVRDPQKLPNGSYAAVVQVGIMALDAIIATYKDATQFEAKFVDLNEFKAADFFDAAEGHWSLKNFIPALQQAKAICQKIPAKR